MNGKSDGQIVRDAVRKRRLSVVGFGIFFLGILLLSVLSELSGGKVSGGTAAAVLVVIQSGWFIAAASSGCPICDTPIRRSGACVCQRNKMERSIYIDVLKKKVAKASAGGA